MANRKPLVLNSGVAQELGGSDSLLVPSVIVTGTVLKELQDFINPTLGIEDNLEVAIPIQKNLFSRQVRYLLPIGNGQTSFSALLSQGATATGTATARAWAATNRLTRSRRIGYVSSASAGTLCGARDSSNASQMTLGDNSIQGTGFKFKVIFCITDPAFVTGARMFVGVGPATAPSNVEVSTKTNYVGVCALSSSNNLHFYCAGSSTTTPIDLGSNFPVNTGSTDIYELTLYAPFAGSELHYRVVRTNTGHIATGTVTTGLPASTVGFDFEMWRTNNATALAVGLDFLGWYAEVAR